MASIAVVVICLTLGAISALEARHVSATHGLPLDWSRVIASTTPRWLLLAIVLPFVFRFAMLHPIMPWRGRVIASHIGAFAALSVAHSMLDSWALGLASPAIPMLFGWVPRVTRSWYNTVPTVLSMYAAVVVAAWGMVEARERQRRTLRASQLETQLQAARLSALRAQLQPHFLYNTLNGIAALVSGVQPARAVAAIEQLGELLHASLRDDGREQITVGEEIALAERYLALQRMRFGERLHYEWQVAPEVENTLVPVLVLQPILENAVVHGLDTGQERLTVRVAAVPTALGVEITVENDGSALREDGARGSGHKVGIASTRARLMTAYGDRASLILLPRESGGVTVRIIVPGVRDFVPDNPPGAMAGTA